MTSVDKACAELIDKLRFYLPDQGNLRASSEPINIVLSSVFKYIKALDTERLLLDEVRNLGT